MTYLNPRVDFAFKKLFGRKGSEPILMSFLNAVLSTEHPITEVVLLNPINDKLHLTDRTSILDVKAVDERGRQYNVEMQIAPQSFFNQRTLYYWSRLYSTQLNAGDGFRLLNKTICINVLNFTYFYDEPDYHSIFKVLSTSTHKNYFDDFEIHFIELTKFDNELSHIKTALDRWVTFLNKAATYKRTEPVPEELKVEAAIQDAFHSLNEISLDEDEREVYEGRLKLLRDEEGMLAYAKEKGLAEGRAEGRAEGIEAGKLTVAKQMLAAHVSDADILKFTSLTQKQLDVLKNKR